MNATTMMKVAILAVSVGLLTQAETSAAWYEATVLGDGATHYWRLGEASGTTAVNLANPGTNDGTYTGGYTLGEAGALFGDTDTAVGVDGIDGHVAAGNLGARPAQGSIEFWMNPDVVENYNNVFSTSGAAGVNQGFRFEERTGGAFFVYAGDDVGSYQAHQFTSSLVAGEWYHVVLTWNNTGNNVTGYLNGEEKFSNTHSKTFVTSFPDVEIGRGFSTGRAWDGLVDEVAMYKKALTVEQVAKHYLISQIGDPPMERPVSYWNFDESASGTGTAYDSIDGNDGTFYGSATRTTGLIGAGAAHFDHTPGDRVDVSNGVGHENDFDFTTGITVEALILPDARLGDRTYEEIFRKNDSGKTILLSFQNNGSILSFGLNTGGNHELDMPLDGNNGRPTLDYFKDGNPHHIVATYDAASGRKAIWVDGIERYTYSFTPGTLISSGGTSPALIGNYISGGEPFAGVIDEVAIYDLGLSHADILWHYDNVMLGRDYYFIPEPSALLLAGIGLLALAGLRRRKRR